MTYVRAFEHTSRVLENNPMGDPHVRKIHVYLPPDYSERRREPYPVVFMLAGWSGRGAHYLADGGAFGTSLPDRLDQLIAAKELPPCILVFPDGTTRLGASQYVNSPVNGNYMDYVCDEIVDWVDSRFHTHKSRDYRGAIGHSSGGFGALAFGMMRSDRFGAICSSAGDSWYDYLYTHCIPQTIEAVRGAGGIEAFVEQFVASPNPLGLLGPKAIVAMLNLSMASCYTPNPHVPTIRGDLWFDLETGELVDEPWQRLLSWDPLRMTDRYVAELRSLRWIHLESGTEDEYGLCLGHRQIARKLDKYGIRYAFDEYPGKHSGHHHRMPQRIQRMVQRMLEPA
jgi:enterochelin esterase-like enzyme